MSTILDLLENASTHPAEVIFLPRRADSTTFEDLWRRSERAASFWSDWPVGTSVAGVLTSSPDMIASLVGAWRAGLRFVSMPLPGRNQDAEAYRAQIENIVRIADVAAIVVEDRYAATLPSPGIPLLAASRCRRDGSRARVHEVGQFVQFSSGTTGAPKGVCLSLSAIGAAVLAQIEALAIRAGDVSCFWVPLSHDFGLVGGLLSSWGANHPSRLGKSPGRFVCLDPAHFITQPASWLEACAAFGATITGGPTFAYGMAARLLERRSPGRLDALRACVMGAEPINVHVVRAFSAAAKTFGFDERAICPAYGLAEATLAVTMKPVEEPWSLVPLPEEALSSDADVGPATSVVCSGKPVGDMQVKIMGGAAYGEVCVRGSSLMSSYLGRDAPFTEEGWLRTGDMGFLRDGLLYVLGREDGMLRVGGRSASAHDLEQCAERHPDVRPGNSVVCSDGAGRYVLAVEHRAGGVDPSLLAALPKTLRADLTRAYGTGPSAVLVVPPGTLPKTPSGKLQRHLVTKNWDALARVAVSQL